MAIATIVAAALGALVTMLVQRKKSMADAVGTLTASERAFRNDIMKRLEHCEVKHEKCEGRLAELHEEMIEMREQLIELRARRKGFESMNIEDPDGDMT